MSKHEDEDAALYHVEQLHNSYKIHATVFWHGEESLWRNLFYLKLCSHRGEGGEKLTYTVVSYAGPGLKNILQTDEKNKTNFAKFPLESKIFWKYRTNYVRIISIKVTSTVFKCVGLDFETQFLWLDAFVTQAKHLVGLNVSPKTNIWVNRTCRLE